MFPLVKFVGPGISPTSHMKNQMVILLSPVKGKENCQNYYSYSLYAHDYSAGMHGYE